ncbi:MAG: hypothetical protein WDW38_008328 [Sanguina aurantia]
MAANGTICCATEAAAPIKTEAISSCVTPDDTAASSDATATVRNWITINRRRSSSWIYLASATFTSEDVQNSSGGSSSSNSEQESSSKAGSSNRNVNIRAPEQSGWLTGRPVQNVETPQVVIDRIFSRMVRFSVAPVSLGIALLGGFYYLKVGLKLEYPIWLVYVSQVFTFGGGLLGITYGVISASWDPSREGTFWGWTEFRANLPILLGSKGTK